MIAAPGRGGRIVLVCDFLLRYTAMLAGGLSRQNAQVALLTRDHDLEFGGRPGAARAFVADAIEPGTLHRSLSGRVRSPRGMLGAVALRHELRHFAPDIVHLQDSIYNDPRLPLVARARRRRFALTVHDPVRHPGDRARRWTVGASRFLVREAGLIFVHGEAIREELIELLDPSAPVVVVPHGVDPAAISAIPKRPSLLFFGRLSHYKGLDVLLDAIELVWRDLPDATLTIAGEGDIEDHPALADDRVDLRREYIPEEEVPQLFEAAGCVVLPYRQASQSGVGSLAKAAGRPLVASALGGLPELLADGSGLLVPAEDPVRLAAALVSVLSDLRLAERLGRAGAATALGQSSWDAVAARTLAAYDEHLRAAR